MLARPGMRCIDRSHVSHQPKRVGDVGSHHIATSMYLHIYLAQDNWYIVEYRWVRNCRWSKVPWGYRSHSSGVEVEGPSGDHCGVIYDQQKGPCMKLGLPGVSSSPILDNRIWCLTRQTRSMTGAQIATQDETRSFSCIGYLGTLNLRHF